MNDEKKLRRLLREYIEEMVLSETDVSQGLIRTRSGEQALELSKPIGIGRNEEERRKDQEKKVQGFFDLADSIIANLKSQVVKYPEKINLADIEPIETVKQKLMKKHKDGTATDADWAAFLGEMQPSIRGMTGGLTRVSPKYSNLS